MKSESGAQAFAELKRSQLAAAAIDGAELVASDYSEASFGDASTLFRVGRVLLRFVSDRGQEFLDVASSTAPTHFHRFVAIEVGMGWKTIEQVLAMRKPESLDEILTRVVKHIEQLDDAFSEERGPLTRARAESAARGLGRRFVDSIRREK